MARILLVDDDVAFCELTERRLERKGHDVAFVTDPRKATHEIAAGAYDLLLLDLTMPELSGEDLLGVMRNISGLKKKPVIIYSSGDLDRLRVAAAQFDTGYVAKSVPIEDLLAKIDAMTAPAEA